MDQILMNRTKIYGQHKKHQDSKSRDKLASEFHRCQFCFELNSLRAVKLNISINRSIGFLKCIEF